MAEPVARPLAILAQRGTHADIQMIASLAATCASIGRSCHILLTHEALHSLLAMDLSQLPSGYSTPYAEFYDHERELERVPDPGALLAEARATGRVRVYACSASISLRRAYTEQQLQTLDGIIGHSTFLSWAVDWQLITV